MFPFIQIGNIYARINPLKDEYDLFFFFPSYSIGGAERVNAEILKSVSDKKIIIFFTKNSPNDGMKHFFQMPNATIKEINKWCDNKWFFYANLFYRGVCSFYINNQHKKPQVFIGQCNFAYKLCPHINRKIVINELIHMYDPRFTWVWAPFVKFINNRILISETIKEKFRKCHIENGIPLKYLQNIRIINYCLEYLPKTHTEKSFNLPLKIYYAGRGGPQKRVWLILKIIEACEKKQLPVVFSLAGSFENELPKKIIERGNYIGEIKGGEAMYQFHKEHDILLMTSAWEGFPIVIMEAMSFGSIPLVTNVDAIPDHISETKNGLLINSNLQEAALVTEAVAKIEWLIDHQSDLKTISKSAYQYVLTHFSPEVFKEQYRKLFMESEAF